MVPIELPAVVGASAPDVPDPGFRADFGDLGPAAFAPIAAVLKATWG